jgi:predicted naringenin-chalcone synthase
VIEAIEERLRDYVLAETREVFRKYENLSSPAVLCALEESFPGPMEIDSYG